MKYRYKWYKQCLTKNQIQEIQQVLSCKDWNKLNKIRTKYYLCLPWQIEQVNKNGEISLLELNKENFEKIQEIIVKDSKD